MNIKAYYQPAPDDKPIPVIIIGFASDGTLGASAVAIYYRPDKPQRSLAKCPIDWLRIEPTTYKGTSL